MEIRDYIERAKREPTRDHLVEMWRAIFTLKAWYFVPARREEGPNRPMVLEVGAEEWIPAFTNVRRYRDFVREAGRLDESGEMHALILDPAASMERLRAVEDALEGVVFNPGSEASVRAPMEPLFQYARRFDVLSFGGGASRDS